MGGGYEEIGSYGDMAGKNLNPYTGGTMSSLQGTQSNLWSMLSGMNPNTMMQGLGQNASGMSDAASLLMGNYASNRGNLGMIQANDAIKEAMFRASGVNAANSGYMWDSSERAAAEPIMRAMTDVAGMQSQLAGGFANQYLGASQNQYNTLASLFGGTQSNIAGLSQYSQYEPQYTYKPGFMDYAAPILGSAAGFMLGGPMGAMAGGQLGGMFKGGGGAPQTYQSQGINPYGGSGNWPYGG